MGALKYIQGNLFGTERPVIAHSVNCCGAFGAGVAGQIARLYPDVRLAYFSKFKKEGWHLGEIQVVPHHQTGKIFVNMAMQEKFGSEGVFIDYDACYLALKTLFRYCEMHWLDVAIPKVGAGLGGGDWNIIERRLLLALEKHNIECDVYYL
jgi:O-acetyl-ADP-ribose deacetylase (regulator of RNase III)